MKLSETGIDCQIWWARPAQYSDRADDLADLLDADEHIRREGYHRPADRHRFTLAAALLRLAVARHLAVEARDVPVARLCPDCPRPHGRPRITGTSVQVSVSHCEDLVAVAVTNRTPVGLDVEGAGYTPTPVMIRRALAPHELASLHELPQVERALAFLRFWTRKEAIVKATGDGLRVPLREVTVGTHRGRLRLTGYPGRADLLDGTVLRDLSAPPGHLASLAALAPCSTRLTVAARDADGLLLN